MACASTTPPNTLTRNTLSIRLTCVALPGLGYNNQGCKKKKRNRNEAIHGALEKTAWQSSLLCSMTHKQLVMPGDPKPCGQG